MSTWGLDVTSTAAGREGCPAAGEGAAGRGRSGLWPGPRALSSAALTTRWGGGGVGSAPLGGGKASCARRRRRRGGFSAAQASPTFFDLALKGQTFSVLTQCFYRFLFFLKCVSFYSAVQCYPSMVTLRWGGGVIILPILLVIIK